MLENSDKYRELIRTLNKIGVALSIEKNIDKLLELILRGAMELTHADGGTLYLINDKSELEFSIIANKTLKIKPSKVSDLTLSPQPIPLYLHGKPNLKSVAAYCYHENKTVSIDDAYHVEGFDFSRTRKADEKINYRSKSFLTIPLRDHENKRIGVLQLINAIDDESHQIVSFTRQQILVAESLASQAAITLTKQELMDAQKNLFKAFLELIAKAIDEKSHYTSNHCKRVPVLTSMIATAMNNVSAGPLKDLHFTHDQFEELMIASWLHDCGKIVTPVYVLDKAKKLHTLCDRIEVINARFEIIKRDLKIAYMEKLYNANSDTKNKLEREYQDKINFLNESQEFLNISNIGGEFLSDKEQARIRALGAEYFYYEGNEKKSLLTEDDIMNLSIARGTLNDKERMIIQNHVKLTHSMLQSLPYPEYLKHVPEIAGSHHERVDGKGYPKGIGAESLSMQARILAIADIFEALTAGDRPYKKAKTLKEVLKIMDDMKNTGHIDPDLYALFINEKIYLEYAKKYLDPEQIDA